MLAKFLTLLTLASFTLSAPLPTCDNTTTTTTAADIFPPLVTLHIFSARDCVGEYREMTLDNHVCTELGEGAKSIRVVEHDSKLRYNALHVHAATGCNSGSVLQPLNDQCSAVVVFKSVRVDFGVPV